MKSSLARRGNFLIKRSFRKEEQERERRKDSPGARMKFQKKNCGATTCSSRNMSPREFLIARNSAVPTLVPAFTNDHFIFNRVFTKSLFLVFLISSIPVVRVGSSGSTRPLNRELFIKHRNLCFSRVRRVAENICIFEEKFRSLCEKIRALNVQMFETAVKNVACRKF